MSTQLKDSMPYNYEVWTPPLYPAKVKVMIEQDLRRALEPHIGKPTADTAERDKIISTIGVVMLKWEELFDKHLDMSITTSEEVASIKFGETELGCEFDFPVGQ